MSESRFRLGSKVTAAAIAAIALGVTPAWGASAPAVTTTQVLSASGGKARVLGTINPHLEATIFQADYGLASSTWCKSGGATGTPEHETSAEADSWEGNEAKKVQSTVSGLTVKQTYCFELLAKNTSGTGTGAQVTFTEGGPAIELKEEAETIQISKTSEGVTAEIEQEGVALLEDHFDIEYGPASGTWCKSHGASGSPEHVTPSVGYVEGFIENAHHEFVLEGLTADVEYCARPQASNEDGENHGEFASFTAGAPRVLSSGTSQPSVSVIDVHGGISLAEQKAKYQVLYAAASEEWCTTGGAKGTHKETTLTEVAVGKFKDIAVEIKGLTIGTAYCGELVVQNETTTVRAALAFRPGEPAAFVETVPAEEELIEPDGDAPYYLNATVNPRGLRTEARAVYSLASSRYCKSGGDAELQAPEHETGFQFVGEAFEVGEEGGANAPVHLGVLTPGTAYCATLILKNSAATVSLFHSFKTQPAVTLTVKVEGTGSGTVTGTRISCPGTCTTAFLATEGTVTLKATAAPGSTFAGWSKFSCVFEGPGICSATRNATVTAIFTSSSSPGGGSSGSGAGSGGGQTGGQRGAGALSCSIQQTGSVKRPPRPKHGHGKKSKPATLPVAVRCNGAASLILTGTLTETVKEKHGHKKSTVRMALGTARGTAVAGATETLTPTLPAKALTALLHGTRLGAALTLTAQGASGSAHQTVSLARLKLH